MRSGATAARTGEAVSEGRRERSDLSTFWAGATLTALRGIDGTLIGFAKVTRDLTERRTRRSSRPSRRSGPAQRPRR
ncbi:MAG TPA: hypothetical protein VK459_04215 [Polyangiaceae bacterium]|nr:hypothetical protein [Polyangiaceae bacterium]